MFFLSQLMFFSAMLVFIISLFHVSDNQRWSQLMIIGWLMVIAGLITRAGATVNEPEPTKEQPVQVAPIEEGVDAGNKVLG